MPIRFSHSELWDRDWFLSLEGKFQLFVLYLRDHCNHAGIWQPSFKRFEQVSGFRIFSEEFLLAVNSGAERIRVLKNKKWWITGYIEDQYKGMVLKESNNAHRGVIASLRANEVDYLSIGYKLAPGDESVGPKSQVHDSIDASSLSIKNSGNQRKNGVLKLGFPQVGDISSTSNLGYQDKDKDKDSINLKHKKTIKVFIPPSIEDVKAYCIERNNKVNPDRWHAHYTSNGWKVGMNAMKDWRAAVRTWEHGEFNQQQQNPQQPGKTAAQLIQEQLEKNRHMDKVKADHKKLMEEMNEKPAVASGY